MPRVPDRTSRGRQSRESTRPDTSGLHPRPFAPERSPPPWVDRGWARLCRWVSPGAVWQRVEVWHWKRLVWELPAIGTLAALLLRELLSLGARSRPVLRRWALRWLALPSQREPAWQGLLRHHKTKALTLRSGSG